MHMRAWSLNEFGGQSVPGCIGSMGVEIYGIDPVKPFDFTSQVECSVVVPLPATDREILEKTIAGMKRFNIVAGVIAGDTPVVAVWRSAYPDHFIPAASFFMDEKVPRPEYIATLKDQVERGETQIFAEITAQYR